MRTRDLFLKEGLVSLIVAVAVSGIASFAAAQNNVGLMQKTKSPKSRAQQAAEQSVALSPDKIVDMLRQEPGLMLEVKKMLVRKAYEQGRILDPEDLTDDALFELLRADHNICVLATLEIEDRQYV